MGRRIAWLIPLLLTACGGDGASCVSGASAACTCTDGRSGAQTCGADGTFGPCMCTGPSGEDAGGATIVDSGVSDAGPPRPLRVFVSSLTYRPAALADVCANAALAQGLGGRWVAWLSRRYPAPTPDADAIDEVEGAGPWLLLDGRTAFSNRGQLATAPLVPIDVAEDGSTVTVDVGVWTGTLRGGTAGDFDCQRWSENADFFHGVTGWAQSTEDWTEAGTAPCDLRRRVYCFEQP